MKNDYIVVIPARLNSSRLPRKLLLKINGISVLQRTYLRALAAINDLKNFYSNRSRDSRTLQKF